MFQRLLKKLFRKKKSPSPAVQFQLDYQQLMQSCRQHLEQHGSPKGLRLLELRETGKPLFAWREGDGPLFALVPVVVQFELIPGEGMEDVPQAREPRQALLVFQTQHEKWLPTARLVLNLNSDQLLRLYKLTILIDEKTDQIS